MIRFLNPFRTLTLREKLTTLTLDAHEELIQAELSLVGAKARVKSAREKVVYLRSCPRDNMDLIRQTGLFGASLDTGPDTDGLGTGDPLSASRLSP